MLYVFANILPQGGYVIDASPLHRWHEAVATFKIQNCICIIERSIPLIQHIVTVAAALFKSIGQIQVLEGKEITKRICVV